ncbi:MGDG synthase family glycosyltransferase [Bdellovibrio sp. HCB290]|uniref:MGDG synthase family glycosyltransferase n=1 Tax=Bdellovibrio sp. HCB290 TaxID=3394356 RepID=UPI0039B4CDA7
MENRKRQSHFDTWLKTALLLLALLFSTPAFANKKVLILYSTGGHSTAAKSVEEMLKAQPEKYDVIRKDFAEELTGFSRWFYFSGYDLISQKANWINKWGVLSKWRHAEKEPLYASERFNADFNQPENIKKYIESVKPDVVITTHFSLADTLASLREEGNFKNIPMAWTHLDMVDNVFFRQIGDQLDMSFLPTKEMAAEWAKVIPKEKIIATGIPIMPSLLQPAANASEDALTRTREARSAIGLSRNVTTVFMIGGSMGALSYDKIIKDLAKVFADNGNKPVQVIAVCGRNEKMTEWLKAWTASDNFPRNVKLHVEGFVDQNKLRGLQAAADVIISKPGGLTTFELLTSEKPVIMAEGIGIQEQYNAKFVNDKGAALFFPKTKGIGQAIYNIALGDPSVKQSLLINQKKLTENFDLKAIVDWTRDAKVTQPERPTTPILTRMKNAGQLEAPPLCRHVFN